MKNNIVLDISSIIWNESDYETNKSCYYKLADGISLLISKLIEEKPKILMRVELLNEIITNFPFGKIPKQYSDFQTQTWIFLTTLIPSEYSAFSFPNLVSIPNQIKAHYKNTTISEVNYLISKIHKDSESAYFFFTFNYLWNGVNNLTTKVGEIVKKYKTIISDNKNDLDIFFAQFKPVFEHNPKHDKTPQNTKEKWKKTEDKDQFISRLSCYNGKDKNFPQMLLDSGFKHKSLYYNYDIENEVYVIFRFTRKNIDHGYDEYHGYDENDLKKIPNEVRKHFNK